MALIFLVCMNMVVAIITISYEEINDRLKVEERWKHAGRTFEVHFAYRLRMIANRVLRSVSCGRLGQATTADDLILHAEE